MINQDYLIKYYPDSTILYKILIIKILNNMRWLFIMLNWFGSLYLMCTEPCIYFLIYISISSFVIIQVMDLIEENSDIYRVKCAQLRYNLLVDTLNNNLQLGFIDEGS